LSTTTTRCVKPPGRLLERSHHVHAPHRKRPCDGDGLERMRREVGLSCVELTPLAASHNVLGVSHRRCPVKTLLESFPDKASWTSVMYAHSGMDLL
jgi:hypothetical protein